MKPNLKKLQAQVDAWNTKVTVGQEISYSEILGDPPKLYKTRTEAQILCGHSAVVWLHGIGGCVLVSHCTAMMTP